MPSIAYFYFQELFAYIGSCPLILKWYFNPNQILLLFSSSC